MSPLVQLFCYPHDDGEFASGVSLDIHVPHEASLVHAVLDRLRTAYPRAAIRVEPDGADGDGVVWHVYRDGVPA